MDTLTEDTGFAGLREPEQGHFWLGVDGGGTNTCAAILNTLGELCGEGHADAANFLRVGLEAAAWHGKVAGGGACAQARLHPPQIAGARIGLAGVAAPKH